MDTPDSNSLAQQFKSLLGEEPSHLLRELFEATEAVDIAHALSELALIDQQMVLGMLAEGTAAQVLSELDDSQLTRLLPHINAERTAAFIVCMEPDNAADMVELLRVEAPDVAEAVELALPAGRREEVRLLLTYGPDTAGGLMDPDVVQVRASSTVAQALAEIRRYVERVQLDDFFAVFAIDSAHKLVGVVPTWKLLLADGEDLIEATMVPDPISVEAHLDQEYVSHLVRDHNLVTLPVVDSHMRLLGRITVDDVVDVIEEEHQEDLGRLSGTGAEGVHAVSLWRTLRDRAPWLFIALVGEFVSAMIMRSRQDYLAALPQLAFFIPVIMAMGGNTGMQSASLVIRGLATGEVRLSHFWRRLGREFVVALCMGLLFASVLVVGSVALTGRPGLGLAVGLSTLTTITLASTGGIVIPMVLRRMDLDPALATGPFLTTMNDVMGIIVYLLIAYLILF